MRRPTAGTVRAVAGGLLAAAAVGAVTVAGTLAPVPERAAVPARAVAVAPADTLLACPGPPTLSGAGDDSAVGAIGSGADEQATDAEFSATPAPTSTRTWLLSPDAGPDATVLDLPAGPGAARAPQRLPTDGVARAALTDAGPIGVRLGASGDTAATAGGLVVASTAAGDLRGLSASACLLPGTDHWLLGSGTEAGHSARLVLMNPGSTVATVDVEVLTGSGPQPAPGGRGLVVAPGQRHEVLLEGLVPAQPHLAVHVTATGGQVAAVLADSVLRGLVPGGVDVVAPAAPPGTRQVVGGVLTRPGTTSALRLLAPGPQDAAVAWRLLGPAGHVVQEGAALSVPAGTVMQVPLEGLQDGVHTVVVESQSPVVAAVGVLSGTPSPLWPTGGPDLALPTDLAWSPSAPLLTGDTRTAVVVLPQPQVGPDGTDPASLGTHLALGGVDPAPGGAPATVRVRPVAADGSTGAALEVGVPTGVTALADVTDFGPVGTLALLIDVPAGAVSATLLLTGADGSVSVVPVRPGEPAAAPVALRGTPAGSWP